MNMPLVFLGMAALYSTLLYRGYRMRKLSLAAVPNRVTTYRLFVANGMIIAGIAGWLTTFCMLIA